MRVNLTIIGVALFIFLLSAAARGQSEPTDKQTSNAGTIPTEASLQNDRADKRYDEMLGKMQAAVEEIAQLYGNPIFLQVFTNDAERASELKERLRSARSSEEARRDLTDLEKKREDLLSDIALREKESARLTSKLERQRVALDALANAVDQAKKAVEETAK